MNFLQILCAAVLSVSHAATESQLCQNQGEQDAVFTCGCPGLSDLNQKLDSMEQQIRSLQSKSESQKKALIFNQARSIGDKIFVTNGLEASYKDANRTCSEAGGQMASPRNRDEDQMVMVLALQRGKKPFLGINDIKTEGRFEYPDGEEITYSNWSPTEPNNDLGIEDCVEMFWNGQWNDKSCQEKRMIICEFA